MISKANSYVYLVSLLKYLGLTMKQKMISRQKPTVWRRMKRMKREARSMRCLGLPFMWAKQTIHLPLIVLG